MSKVNDYLLEITETETNPDKIYKTVRDDHFEDYDDQISAANYNLKVRKEMKELAFLETNPAHALDKMNRHAVSVRLGTVVQKTDETGLAGEAKDLDFTEEETSLLKRAILRTSEGSVIQRGDADTEVIRHYLNRIDERLCKWNLDYSDLLANYSNKEDLKDLIDIVCMDTVSFLKTLIDHCPNKNSIKVLLEALF